MIRTICRVAILVLAFASPAPGRDVTVKLAATTPDRLPFVVPLAAPGAYCAAAGDAQGMVAVGHKVGKEGQLSLFRLDAQGRPTGAPVIIKLPKPAALAARDSYPLSLEFHPSLPLLYVWQDVEALKGDPVPPTDPAWNDFDHLLVYALDGPAPELLLALSRGPRFHTGNLAGALCLDAANGRLYVPNLRFGIKNPPDSGSVGWFSLADDGLPVAGDEEPARAEPPAAPAKAAAGRPARVGALRTALAAGKAVGAFRHIPEKTYGFEAFPCGAGWLPVSRDVFVTCGNYGPTTWNRADPKARAQVFLMPVNFVVYQAVRIAPHPHLPVLYATIAGYSYAHRVEHADGYVTLAPQVLLLEGATLRTPPVVLAKHNLVAWGTTGAVYLAVIDAEGRFKEEKGIQVDFPGVEVRGLAYSEKLDRLYVGVEKAK